MTKKDYIRIARAIKAARDSYQPNWDANLFRAVDDVTLKIADELQAENINFNRATFLKACK